MHDAWGFFNAGSKSAPSRTHRAFLKCPDNNTTNTQYYMYIKIALNFILANRNEILTLIHLTGEIAKKFNESKSNQFRELKSAKRSSGRKTLKKMKTEFAV